MDPILAVSHLSKAFAVKKADWRELLGAFGKRETVYALKEVHLSVHPGQIIGIAGPNGAGKTTLMRIIADLVRPDEGTVRICGKLVKDERWEIRKWIGYASSDERSFFWRLSGRQNLEYFAQLYSLSRKDYQGWMSELLELFNVRLKADTLFRDYSAGTRKKFSLIRALLHRPRLLLLDEITNSLDPDSAQTARRIVREYVSSHQAAALWSTHRLEEISELCDGVFMFRNGQVVNHEVAKEHLCLQAC